MGRETFISKGTDRVEHEATQAPNAGASLGRRRALTAGLGGALAAIVAGADLVRATTPDTGPTTTTSPPQRPTAGDVATLASLQSLELAVRDLYTAALATDGLDDSHRTVFSVLRDAHDAYAQAMTGVLGRGANQTPSTALAGQAFSGDGAAIAKAAYGIEAQLVATHHAAIATLASTDAGTLVASVAVSEARHGVVLADLSGSTSLDELLVSSAATPLATKG